jgi:hypothetical protein
VAAEGRQRRVAALTGRILADLRDRHLELRVRLIARHAGLETPDQDQRAAAAIRDRKTRIGVDVACDRIVHADRQVILGSQDGCGAGEALRGHADNGEVLSVDADGLLEDVAIESRSLPDLVADDHRARRRALFDIDARSIRIFHFHAQFRGVARNRCTGFAAEVHCRGMPPWRTNVPERRRHHP